MNRVRDLEYALLPGLMKRIRRDSKSDQDALWDLRKGKTTRWKTDRQQPSWVPGECTPYGEELSIIHAENLALAGVQVISGMARGVDSISQRAAIEAGGESYGVLGCGVDVCYPKENKGLYIDLQKHGGILSELPLGTAPLREYFPARNRMISGLADMILVMEAKEKSGSLITAAFALDQGKTIYALPGPVTSELSKGCNRIISDGAVPLLSPKYLLEQEELKLLKNHTNSPSDRVKNEKVLESPEKLLYATVGLVSKEPGYIAGGKRDETNRYGSCPCIFGNERIYQRDIQKSFCKSIKAF